MNKCVHYSIQFSDSGLPPLASELVHVSLDEPNNDVNVLGIGLCQKHELRR